MNRALLAAVATILGACTPSADPPADAGMSDVGIDVPTRQRSTAWARPDHCYDGEMNRDESDSDCGGSCAPCLLTQTCNTGDDCVTGYCEGSCWDTCFGARWFQPRVLPTPNPTELDLSVVDARPIISGGPAIADFDGDDIADVFVTNATGPANLLLGNGDFFDDASDRVAEFTDTTSVTVVDIDADGDLDLFLGRIGGRYLLLNDGGGHFTDVTEERGLADPDDVVSGGEFVDFDRDGDLDLYVTGYATAGMGSPEGLPNQLYRNDEGVFSPLADAPGSMPAPTLAAAWFDVDDDGAPDLWVVNDFGPQREPNRLYLNRTEPGGTPAFEEVSAEWGFDQRMFGMSALVADLDNDGFFDAYAGNIANNVLLHGGPAPWPDVAREVGLGAGHRPNFEEREFNRARRGMGDFIDRYVQPSVNGGVISSWETLAFDADQDGWQDMFVVNGMVITDLLPEQAFQRNQLFINEEDRFVHRTCAISTNSSSARGAAVGDLDGDRDLDLVVVSNGIIGTAQTRAHYNDVGNGRALTVELHDSSRDNVSGIGAVIRVERKDAPDLTRLVRAGNVFLGATQHVAHFGVGASGFVDVVVDWPTGERQRLDNVPTDRHLLIRR